MKPIIEFLMWDNCNNNCRFCFLKHKNDSKSFLDDNGKADSINKVIDYLNTKFISGSDILLCGGEIFDSINSITLPYLLRLANTISLKILDGSINKLFINTNLIYDIHSSLLPFLDIFNENNLISSINFTTSFDLVGRFKNTEDKNLFTNNCHLLKSKYTDIHIIANMVMTKPVCNLILNDDINIIDLENNLNSEINIIPYIILTDDLAPSKELVLSTIEYVGTYYSGFVDKCVNRFLLNQPRLLLKYYNGKYVEMTSDNSVCGHSVNFKRYTNTNSCFICDLKERFYGKIS